MAQRLPIEECLPQLVAAVAQARPVILRAPPGAGKTTGVPPALLSGSAFHKRSPLPSGQILLLQPRRLAARAAAHRLSELAGERVGATYGYHVRFDRRTSDQTRVIAMTNGILLRRLVGDPLLEDVTCVLLDEFHERSLELDLALGMLQRIRTTLRPELRLVVMSATLQTEPVERLLDDAVTIESTGRAFPVDVRYESSLKVENHSRQAIAQRVAAKVPEALHATEGDVLAFLPGIAEIRRTARLLREQIGGQDVAVAELYGDLSPAEQDAVLAPSRQRKVVLATNVAETSVTIPGITAVIDTGLHRAVHYDAAVGIPSLTLQPISRASADQRAGRAGRTAPGVCFRLWPEALDRGRDEHTPAEIVRADLSAAVLSLATWGERDMLDFPWVTPPPAHAIQAARRTLLQLGALDETGAITPLGERMNHLPLHPRLARLLLAAQDQDCLREASLAAAFLSERDPFGQAPVESHATAFESDLLHRVLKLQAVRDGRGQANLERAAVKSIDRVASQLRRPLRERDQDPAGETPTGASLEERFSRALLAAFPDRLAHRRGPGSEAAVMVGGRGVVLDPHSTVRHSELFLCIRVDGKDDHARVRIASAIEEAWLDDAHQHRRRECFFHPPLQAVVARQRRYWLDLLLEESPVACQADASTAELLRKHAAKDLAEVLPPKNKSLENFLARWRFLQHQLGADALPMAVDEALQTVLADLCTTRTSYKELRQAPWLDYLQGRFGYQHLQWMDEQAPEALTVPSGNRIRLTYAPGKPPVLAVRIQELFGWKQTPTLAGGQVPVQLHLLAPNHRPQQITDDLASFWRTTYREVRKELKRRYAKHHWPEDPWTAQATRNGLKPR